MQLIYTFRMSVWPPLSGLCASQAQNQSRAISYKISLELLHEL